MTALVAFYLDRPLAQLELLRADGSPSAIIPAWLVDRPDVLAALQAIAEQGGAEALRKVPEWHDLIVDPVTRTISFRLETT